MSGAVVHSLKSESGTELGPVAISKHFRLLFSALQVVSKKSLPMIDLSRSIQTIRDQCGTAFGDCASSNLIGVGSTKNMTMQNLIHWFMTSGSLLAVLVTAGVAVLLVCCLGCSECPCREKDDLFRRREV
jgi:hypothetical protein